jgi:hypothetical protein
MPPSPSHARDAALARMRRINRWLVAGAIVATGLLTEAAAQAFPGRTITRAEPSSAAHPNVPRTAGPTHRRHRHNIAKHTALTPPAQAPQPQAQVRTTIPAPPQPAPTQVAPPPVAPEPVVSGGS